MTPHSKFILAVASLGTVTIGFFGYAQTRYMIRESEFNELADLACRSDSQVLSRSLPSGYDLDASPSDEGKTLLQTAAWCGNEDTVTWLLAHGANPNKRGSLDRLPIEVSQVTRIQNILRRAMERGRVP